MNNTISIFDSLTHPTINGDWILPQYPQKGNLKKLLFEMEQNNIVKALAVGMEGIGGYEETKYVDFIYSQTDKLIPVAFFSPRKYEPLNAIKQKIKTIKKLNYKAIKLHPRIGKFNLTNAFLPDIVKIANDNELAVLLCTYFYSNTERSYLNNTENLISLLEKIPNEKIILLHSGAVKVLEYMEIARAFKNVLLDLSFTIVKYEGTSLDNDLWFLFHKFDRRICVGSDFPEISMAELRKRFDFFSTNISYEKKMNIAQNNLIKFLTLTT